MPFAQDEFPSVQFLRSEQNTGFAHACNWGSLYADSEWILFLNPDVSISATEVSQWVRIAQEKSFDASSPESNDPRYTKPLPNFWSLMTEFSPLHRFISVQANTLTLVGGALLVRKTVFIRIGGFDERFFLWFEDSDLTIRLIQDGARIGRVNVEWNHIGGGSFRNMLEAERKKIFFHSLDVFSRKHFSSWQQYILRVAYRRFSKVGLLPVGTRGVSLIVPNMERNLLEQFFKGNPRIHSAVDELIVVTSALHHDMVWEFRRRHPSTRFINIEQNHGFAETVNVGIRVARSLMIGTQNDDVESDGSWVRYCAEQMTQQVGSINPIIYHKNGAIESLGIQVLSKGKAEPIRKMADLRTSRVDATNAAAVLYHHEALERVGLFDERFGSYLEDIDLSLRLTRAGFKNLVCTDTSVIHHGQSTSKQLSWKKHWLDVKNWWLVIFKNFSWQQILLHAPAIILERARNLSGLLRAVLS